nr:MAG: putative replicase [Heilongjiang sediment hepe-like virus 1]
MSKYINPYSTSNRPNETANIEASYISNAKTSAINISSTVVKCPFALSEAEFAWLQAQMKDRQLVLDNGAAPLMIRSHALAAFMNWYAYDKCKKIAKRFTSVIDVGGNFEQHSIDNCKIHVCAKITNTREKSRYTNAALRTNNNDLLQMTNTGKSTSICYLGAENCTLKAQYGFSVNSHYDITGKQLVDIFAKHQIMFYDICMYLPSFLINNNLKMETPVYQVRIIKDKVYFYFADPSNGYCHSLTNWRQYLTTNVINAGSFSLIFERIEHISDFYIMRVNRVENPSDVSSIFYAYNISEVYKNNIVLIPNYIETIKMIIPLYNSKLISAQANYVHNVVGYGIKLNKEAFTWPNFLVNAIAFSKSLKYSAGTDLVFEGIDETNNEFHDLVLNLFIYTAILRYKQTSTISKLFAKIKKDSLISKPKKIINNFIARILGGLINDLPDKIISLFHDNSINHDNDRMFRLLSNICDTKIIEPQEFLFETTYATCGYTPDMQVELDWKINQQIIETPVVTIPPTDKVWSDGQCGFEAVEQAIKTRNKSAIRTMITEEQYQLFLLATYTLKYDGKEVEQYVIGSAKDNVRKLKSTDTWLTAEEIMLLCYINDFNCIIAVRANGTNLGSTYTFRFNETAPLIIRHDGLGHWFTTTTVGGYRNIIQTSNKIMLTNRVLNNKAFMIPEPTSNHMEKKMQEVYKIIVDNKFKNVLDLTSAPGTLNNVILKEFVKSGNKYNFKYDAYSKIDYLKYTRVDSSTKYYETLGKIPDFSQYDLVIVDFFIHQFDEYEKLIGIKPDAHITLSSKTTLLTKIDPFHEDYIKNEGILSRFSNKKLFMLENTLIQSAETYALLFNGPIIYNNDEFIVDVDKTVNVDHVEVKAAQHRKQYEEGTNNYRNDQDYKIKKVVQEFFKTKVELNANQASMDQFAEENNMPKIKLKNEKHTMFVYDGMAGAAKTQRVINAYKPAMDWIISPITPQCSDKMITTYVTALHYMHRPNFKKLRYCFIDELFACPRSSIMFYIYFKEIGMIDEIYGLGDSKQIGTYNDSTDATTLNILESHYVYETKRCPQDVCLLLKDYFKRIPTTSSKVVESIKYVSNLKEVPKVDLVMAFTHDAVKFMRDNVKCEKALTVNASQGATVKKAVLHLDSFADIRNLNKFTAIRQAYVAISRHTDELFVYRSPNSGEDLKIIMTIEGSNVETTAMHASVPILVGPQLIETDIKRDYKTYDAKVNPTKETVIDILQNVCKTKTFSRRLDKIIEPYVIPKPDGVKMKISPDVIKGVDVIDNTNVISDISFSLPYYSKDKFATVCTQISRYGNLDAAKIEDHFEHLQEGLSKFVDYDAFLKHKASPERIFTCFTDYLIELQKKLKHGEVGNIMKTRVDEIINKEFIKTNLNNKNIKIDDSYYQCRSKTMQELNYLVIDNSDDETEYVDMKDVQSAFVDIHDILNHKKASSELLLDPTNPKNKIISFTMKKQNKHDPLGKKTFVYKAGQGVSAWMKVMNLYFCAYSRHLTESLFKSVKKNVCIAFNKSDAEISQFLVNHGNTFNSNYTNVDCDFSEMDKSHTKSMLDLECWLFGLQSVPMHVIDFYRGMREKWTNLYRCKEGISVLHGQFMQHSGQPMTITGNTLLNMAVLGMAYKFDALVYAMFKGDDCHIKAAKFMKVKGMKTLLYEDFGYKLKIDSPKISEFIANIVTPYGFFPDVIRRVSKAVNKGYRDESDWEESRLNIQEVLSVVNNADKRKIGVDCAVIHYQENGYAVSEKQIETMYDYLITLSKSTFADAGLTTLNTTKTYTDQYKAPFMRA